jgi:dinuclear metal center YbgI/SA1388 family protein
MGPQRAPPIVPIKVVGREEFEAPVSVRFSSSRLQVAPVTLSDKTEVNATAAGLARYLDELLRLSEVPDYEGSLNGLQFDHEGPVRKVAAAVDISIRVIEAAAEARANFLLVHHGLFWGGARPVTGAQFERTRLLVRHDIAVYASHLPLDAHSSLGNNALLARELGLEVSKPFAYFRGVPVGVAGESDLPTASILSAADRFARQHGGAARSSFISSSDRRTQRWAICTGAGASSDTLAEARAGGIDTLIVGEGPHHTAVDAPEQNLVVIYAGHYATETLGVAAVARHLADRFDLPWTFVPAPTGL